MSKQTETRGLNRTMLGKLVVVAILMFGFADGRRSVGGACAGAAAPGGDDGGTGV